MDIFPKGTKTKPMFKTYEEYEKYCKALYKDIEPDIKKYERARARSEAIARGLNPDSIKF